MGAFTAPLLCDRVSVRLIVLVAPMIPAPGESPGKWWTSSGQTPAQREQDEREGRDPDAPFDVTTAFLHDVPEEIVADLFARGEPRQSDTPFAEPWPLSGWPSVPTKVLAGRHDRLFPLDFMRRLARERLGVEADVIDSGHLPALSRPKELAERLASPPWVSSPLDGTSSEAMSAVPVRGSPSPCGAARTEPESVASCALRYPPERLSREDAGILGLELGNVRGHTVKVFLGEGRHDVVAVRRHVAARLGAEPRLKQRLAPTPLRLAPPAWVDDPSLDLTWHVRARPSDGDLRHLVAT